MSDPSVKAGEEGKRHSHGRHHEHRSSADKKTKEKQRVFHHNHYRTGSLVSSYTAVNEGGPPNTSPFRSCRPNPVLNDPPPTHDKKRIELVIKQAAPVGYPPPEQYGQGQILIQPPPYYPPAPQYPQPIQQIQYEPPPPARRYEVYRRTEEDERRFGQVEIPEPQRKGRMISEGTGGSMGLLRTESRKSVGNRRNRVSFEEKKVKGFTVGTGGSMIIDPGPAVQVQPTPKLIIVKRPSFKEKVYDNFSPSETVYSEQGKSREEVKSPDLCPLCHKGWYVKKFTWSGIVAAIFCFPCGILACFKMRTYVCSFCGEGPVAEYQDYKEGDLQKSPAGPEDSRSRLIPPQKPSTWTKNQEVTG